MTQVKQVTVDDQELFRKLMPLGHFAHMERDKALLKFSAHQKVTITFDSPIEHAVYLYVDRQGLCEICSGARISEHTIEFSMSAPAEAWIYIKMEK